MKRLSDFAPQFPNNAVCLTAGMRCEEEAMTIEEAIKFAKYTQTLALLMDKPEEVQEFYGLAEAALRAQYEQEKNGPLTLDELREMDGEPVWIEASLPFWALVSVHGGEVLLTEQYGETVKAAGWIKHTGPLGLLYRRKPEEVTK